MKIAIQRRQHEIEGVMLGSVLQQKWSAERKKPLSCRFFLSWWFASGQWISSGLFSDWGFSQTHTHRDVVWSEPSDTSGPKKDSFFSHQWRSSFLSPYVLHYCSQSRTCLAERLLLAQRSPVAACQVHNWTTRDGKQPLTNDSFEHMLWEMGGFQSLEILFLSHYYLSCLWLNLWITTYHAYEFTKCNIFILKCLIMTMFYLYIVPLCTYIIQKSFQHAQIQRRNQ